jgi:hypothetical protein
MSDLDGRAVHQRDRLVPHSVEQREQLTPDRTTGTGN